MEFLSEYGLFLAKSITVIITAAIIGGILASFGQKNKKQEKGHIEVVSLNKTITAMSDTLADVVMSADSRKAALKAEKKNHKTEQKAEKKALKSGAEPVVKKRVFVLDFHGDIRASAVDSFREEITTVLAQASSDDEVVVRLESGGGMVPGYGLAASQLDRIKKKNIPLTICIDKVAASGGYMMACVADKILASPFAVLGSIGVVAQIPNFNKLLKKNNIDIELLTAGEHKRTLTMLGENTDEGRRKFKHDLEDTHELFKSFVRDHRPVVDIAEVANGDVWFGKRALDVKLIDEIKTSDEYITEACETLDVFEVSYKEKKSLQEKLGLSMSIGVDKAVTRLLSTAQNSRFMS